MSNVKVYDLIESMIASGYAMRTDIGNRELEENDRTRGLKLVKASYGNGSHAQWLTGVRVNFDVTFSNKAWVEAERYRFLEFVTSQSTMHRITRFDLKGQCNEYVDARIIDIVQEKIDEYNRLSKLPEDNSPKIQQKRKEILNKLYLEILYNIPAGFKITARLTTNYRCLLNIYIQRYNHRLPEWREFCNELLLNLPMFKEIVDAYFEGGKR
ncbi:MAG: hypothetical protein IKU01_01595 [Bacteroidales bacterium]|nr:hypothetical protein [Bacteroidales bacterium]